VPEKSLQSKHGYVDNNGVKIHYAEAGVGPLVVMIHGFPDFWYTWRHQMAGLSGGYRVVAIDQRGYNLSDQPEGVENYDMRLLVSDVAAVVRHLGEEYVEAFQRSDFAAMLNYYKRNYPDIWSETVESRPTAPNVNVSTLVFHGLDDTALHSDGLNNTWDWVDKDLTLVTVPGAGHFVQQDAAELVTSTMRSWLDARRK
jgi:pimeloyl-ACP methyl ester carboxylesterase